MGATIDLTQRRIYFFGGIFSQWARCKIYDFTSDSIFNCAEQAMMYHKALIFKDWDACKVVMAEKDPRNQKAIGRTIKNYDDTVWSDVRFDVVRNYNYLKFSQHPEWKELLIYTDGYEIFEASSTDCVWGIGVSEEDAPLLDKKDWRGKNLLGEAIMSAREQIIKEL